MTSLHREQKYYHFEKEQFLVDKLVYVKNINKLQNTEEIIIFICPASQFIFLKLYFETVYIFSFSNVGSERERLKRTN